MSDAVVRFVTLIQPGPSHGLAYLKAFVDSGLGVRAAPIGAAFLVNTDWLSVFHLFSPVGLAPRYVNVVCAPPNLLLGTVLRDSDVKPPTVGQSKNQVVYQPQTALAGSFMVGMPNVAITWPQPAPPNEHEVAALLKYDVVLCPKAEDSDVLRHLGVTAAAMPADFKELRKVIESLL